MEESTVDSDRKWSPIACPTCKSRSLSFVEARRTLVYYRGQSEISTRDGHTRGGKRPFVQVDSRTSYVSDIQARCDDCGLVWVLKGTRRIEDLETAKTQRPTSPEAGRSIRTAELVEAIRGGLTDTQLISKFDLNPRQLEVLLQQLVQRGLLSEKEIDRRLDLADTAVTRAFDDTRRSIQELDSDVHPEPNATDAATNPPRSAERGLLDPGVRVISVNNFIRDVKQGLSDSYLMTKYSLSGKQLEFMFQRLVETGRVTLPELYERTSVYGSSITKAFVEVYNSLRELDE